MSLFSFDWLHSSATFAAALIVEFMFSSLLSWLLTILTNWSSLYFLFKYSAILLSLLLLSSSSSSSSSSSESFYMF
jgi:hypothetical protein